MWREPRPPLAAKLALVLALCVPGLALAQFDLQQLIQQQQTGSASAAFAYAERYRAEQEGDPRFDYYYGMAAIDSGHASQGVFALERVVAVQPGNHAARLELARGYFILEEYARSRAEFEIVLAANPPQDVRSKIDRFLDAIRLQEGRYRTTGTGFAQLVLGSDSNINSAPADEQLSSGVILDQDSVETEDTFTGLTAGAQMSWPVAPGRTLFGTVTGDLRAHGEEDQFDNHTVTAQGGLVVRRGQNRYQADLQYQTYVFDGDTFRNLIALNGEWRLRTSELNQFSLFLQFAGLEYPDQEIRDSTLITAGAGYTGQFAGRLSPVWFASAYAGAETPEDSSEDAARVAERNLFGVRLGTQLTVAPRSTLRLTASVQSSAYGEEDIFEGEKRDDTYSALALDWAWLLNRTFSLHARASRADNASNIEVNDFERTVYDIGLRATFN